MAERAPLRDVVEVRELEGERGGIIYVMQLECGCLIWQRKPRKSVRCVPCWWKESACA